MQAEVKNGNLVLTIPLNAPRPSSSGKNLVVASTGGGKSTAATLEGKNITVNLTAWIAPN